METLFNVINAMLTRTFSATMNEYFMVRIFFSCLMLAMLVAVISALRLGVQFIIKRARK